MKILICWPFVFLECASDPSLIEFLESSWLPNFKCEWLKSPRSIQSLPLQPSLSSIPQTQTLTHTPMHLCIFAQYMRITQISHSDHTLNPKGKWHNRDTKASHLHLRGTASYRLRWGSTLALLGGYVGSFSLLKWTSHPLYMKIRLAAHFTRLDVTGGKQTETLS